VLSIAFGDLLNVDHAWVITEWIAEPLAAGWNLMYVQPVGILLSHSWSVNTVRRFTDQARPDRVPSGGVVMVND
jgi:hypothetical protein